MARYLERLRPREERPVKPATPAKWKRVGSHLDATRMTPPPIAAELVVGQAVPELLELEPSNPPPPMATIEDGPAWSDERTRYGEANGRSKLTAADAREIRRLHAAGRSVYSLAREFSVSRSAVRAIGGAGRLGVMFEPPGFFFGVMVGALLAPMKTT